MNIAKKIQQIRRQPEHVRLRWVWICVSICMFFIIIVWLFSINLMFQTSKNELKQTTLGPNTDQQIDTLKQQAPSLEDFTKNPLSIDSEGIANSENTDQTAPYNPQTGTSEAPQTDAYSTLQNTGTNQ